jgi:two-component system phosphate regulon response regulator OmpR
MTGTRVLVLDDDEALGELLTEYLGGFGFTVRAVAHPEEGLRAIRSDPPDLVVLDLMLPGMDGLAVCRKIRETSRVPIVMLTARGGVMDRILGLELGADDYLPKPFEPRELLLRLGNILKRAVPVSGSPGGDVPDVVHFGPFSYRFDRGELRREDEIVRITEREREILTILGTHAGDNVPREALAGHGIAANERTVDVQINRLRRKIEADPANPVFLQTVRGIGYRLVIDR